MDAVGRASRIRGAFTLAVLAALVITALMSPVGAALNKKKVNKIVKKTAYTKAEADGRFINIGEKSSDSELLDGVDSGGFIQPEDRVLVSTGNRNWVSQSTGITANHASNTTLFTSGGADANTFLGVSPDLPVALYGRSLQLRGVEFCYTNSDATTLDAVILVVFENSTGGSATTEAVSFLDDTDREDDACRLYTLPTPLTLTGEHLVGFTARVDFVAPTDFQVARTTFVLEATGTPAAPLARPGEGVVLTPAHSDAGEA